MKAVLHVSPARSSRHRSQTASFVLKALPSALALAFLPAGWAQATINTGGAAGLPQNGTVFSGTADGSVAANQLTVNQGSARAVIDWTSFNIDAGKIVQFVQPTGGAVLNRVSAATNASQIAGTLSANGMVMLMNPHGVLFSAGSSVNVGALIATTGTIDENTFSDTGAQITGATTGVITNQGNITTNAAANGLVALVAPSVLNQGVIAATGGTIALLGTTATTISLNNNLYEFAIPGGATGTVVTNAAGASLSAKALHLGVGDAANLLSGVINLEGVQQATDTIVVNGDQVHLKSALQAPGVSGNSNTVDVYAGASIQDGVKIAKTGTAGAGATVHVNAGTYTEQVNLNKANLTLTGREGAKIFVPTPGPTDNSEINGMTIAASNVTVSGLEIAGDLGNQSHGAYAWDNRITRGIWVRDGVTQFTISGNNIHDVRNGILVHGRNATQSRVTGNRIENTKGAISVQYTDGSGITIADNTQGPNGNEWGLNLHLNGHLDGAGNILGNTPPIAAAPTLAWQQALLDLSTSNDGWSVQDQGYTSSNRTHVNVAVGGSAGAQGSARSPINTLQGGVNAVVTGGTVNVAAGTYVQPGKLVIEKSLTLSGAGEGSTLIDARGVNGYGITVSADDVSLKNFTFYGPSANIGTAYGIKVSPLSDTATDRVHNFAISNVTIRGSGRAELDLNGVVGAVIDHVTADGRPVGDDTGVTEGAGIQITDSQNVEVRNSTTRGNKWGGLAIYQANRAYNQQVNNITVEANNSFGEWNPVYLQDESSTRDFGALNIAGFDYAVRNTYTNNSDINNHQYTWLQATRQNAFDLAVNTSSSGDSYVQGWSGTGTTQTFSVGTGTLTGGGTQAMSIGKAVDVAAAGATVNVAAGTYVQPGTLAIEKSLTLSGAGEGSTLIDARGVNGYGMFVTADDVTLKNFTLYGPTANIYGIKVQPNSETVTDRVHNFAISNVTIRGSGRAELDLNGVVGAVIDHVTADGRPVGNDTGVTEGAGIQITDSQNVEVRNSTTRGNKWGGLAIYQTNRVYDQQVNNITVEANNSFGEWNPVYLQDESASRNFGALNIAGFDYAVRNSASTNNNHQYTWLQATEQNAFDLAVNTQSSGNSYVQGWSGTGTTQAFVVGTGNRTGGGTQVMSIGAAVDAAEAGASVDVRAGIYAENVSINKALTMTGAGVDQSIVTPTSGDAFAVRGNIGANETVLIDGFTFKDAPGSGVSVANDTVLGQLTVQNSSFNNNGRFGFTVNGSSTAGVALSNVLLRNNRFVGNGNPAAGATSLGLGNVHFNYFNGNATLQDLHITGAGEHNGIHFRGYHTAGGAVRDAGQVVFDNVRLDGSFRRPAGSVGTWNPEGPGYGIHFFEYASVNNVSFNNVVVDTTVGHGIVVEGLGSTLDIGNTRFSRPDTSIVGVGSNPTASLNIATGTNSQNNVKSSVNATRVTFTGANNGFDIEDRVGHALDGSGVGLVTWNAGNVYVTQKSGSVQRGVDAASVGDTVNVAGGSFADNVNVDSRRNLAFNDTRLQSLTLNSGAAGSGIGGAVTAEGAGGFNFKTNVNLLSDTTLTTRGADITFAGDIQNAGGVARALQLVAGSGATRGNVYMNTGGSEANALGRFDVSANNFKLDSTLWVSAYKIDALGDVALSSSTLRAQDAGAASTLSAGGDVTGSTISQGSVALVAAGDIVANIAGTDVLAQAQGNMTVVVAASNSASLSANSVVANVTAPTLNVAAVTEATVSGGASQMTVNAPRGSVSGNFGQVTNTGGGVVNINGKPQPNPTVSSNAENNRVISARGSQEGGVEGGDFQLAQADGLFMDMGFSTPEAAGQALDNGQTVELDLSPRNQRSQNTSSSEQGSESEKDKE